MKNINRIEIQGHVGGTIRPLSGLQGTRGVAFSVATNIYHKDPTAPSGFTAETTWHDVIAWDNKGICDLSLIRSGACVHIIGRIRKTTFTREADGARITGSDVVASEMHIVDMGKSAEDDLPEDNINRY